jgi:predicted lipoprotein with Yx(FWY)xxD motif
MTRGKPITFLACAVAIPLTALAVAACGGGAAATASPPAPSSPTPAKTTATTTPSTATATVRVANSRLGRILVNSQGRTLYLFKADSGAKSACFGACAVAWPPLRTGGKPIVGNGASAAPVGTIPRSDGTPQVTYNGHPLYTFVKDQKPGEVNGQGVTAFGASWFAVSPDGNQISSRPASRGSGSSSPHSTAPAAPAAPAPAPAPHPKPAPQPAPPPAAKTTAQPTPPPAAKPTPPAGNGIPQNNGGDGDSDNNGGPSDGDGNI